MENVEDVGIVVAELYYLPPSYPITPALGEDLRVRQSTRIWRLPSAPSLRTRLEDVRAEELERRLHTSYREARTLSERLQKLERRRSSYLDLAADGDMSREDLRGKLAKVERQRRELEEALRSARNRQQSIEQLWRDARMVWDRLHLIRDGKLRDLTPEERRRCYAALGIRVEIDGEGDVRIYGMLDHDIAGLIPAREAYNPRSDRREGTAPEFTGVVTWENTPPSASTRPRPSRVGSAPASAAGPMRRRGLPSGTCARTSWVRRARGQLRGGRARRKEAAPGSISLRLPFRAPFDGGVLLGFLGARAVPGVEEFEGGIYRRTLRLPYGAAVAGFSLGDGCDRCSLRLEDLRDLGAGVLDRLLRRHASSGRSGRFSPDGPRGAARPRPAGLRDGPGRRCRARRTLASLASVRRPAPVGLPRRRDGNR